MRLTPQAPGCFLHPPHGHLPLCRGLLAPPASSAPTEAHGQARVVVSTQVWLAVGLSARVSLAASLAGLFNTPATLGCLVPTVSQKDLCLRRMSVSWWAECGVVLPSPGRVPHPRDQSFLYDEGGLH